MKKIIGIIGTSVIAMAMFFSTNLKNNANSDMDLASLIAINTANAEEDQGFCYYTGSFGDTCTLGAPYYLIVYKCSNALSSSCIY